MMGVSHAVSGMAAGAVAIPVVVSDLPPVEKIAFVVIVGGWALWNDVDQGGIKNGSIHGSTAARTWGPITALMAAGIGKVADGHRNGTHSFLGIAVFTLIAWLATVTPITSAILAALAIGLALRAAAWLIPGRKEKVWIYNLTFSIIAAGILTFGWTVPARSFGFLPAEAGLPVNLSWTTPTFTIEPVTFAWMPIAVALGMLAHILGDMLTPERCPLFWPVWKKRFGIGLFTTSTPIEAFIVVPLLAAGMVFALAANGLLDSVLGAMQWALGDQFAYGSSVAMIAIVFALLAWKEHAKATSV